MIKLKRDETNTKIINKEEAIKLVGENYHLILLENYLSQLKNQTKVDMSEVEGIIDALEKRIEEIKSFNDNLEMSKEDTNQLSLFYETNIEFINGIIDIYKKDEENLLDKKTMKILIDFLMFSVNKIKNNEINYRRTQETFEKFYMDNKYLDDKVYGELLKSIKEAYISILNKVDESSMEYKEKDYKTLSLINNPNSKYITNEEDITKLNTAAFITTAIVLQGTLILGLIISLLTLVK